MELSMSAGFFATIALATSIGLVAGISPCTLPTAALVVSHVSGQANVSKIRGFLLSLMFITGIAFTLSLLGLGAGMAGDLLFSLPIFKFAVATILVVMGFWMLNIIKFNGNTNILQITPERGSGLFGAFLLGLPFGIAASPCTLPVTLSVLTFSATTGSALYGGILMLAFAVGRSLPLLAIGTFSGLLTLTKRFAFYQTIIQKTGGVVSVALALFILFGNIPQH